MKKDIVAGLGEIGLPILKILSKKEKIVGYDIDKKLMNEKKFLQLNEFPTSFLHIAIPVTTKFDSNVIQLYKKFKPDCIEFIVLFLLALPNDFKRNFHLQ